MNKFRNVVAGTALNDWWDNGNNQIAFCRGDKGFIAINGDNSPLNASLQVLHFIILPVEIEEKTSNKL